MKVYLFLEENQHNFNYSLLIKILSIDFGIVTRLGHISPPRETCILTPPPHPHPPPPSLEVIESNGGNNLVFWYSVGLL